MAWTEHLHTLCDASPDGVLLIDNSGLIGYANPRLNQMLGYGTDEILGLPIEALVPVHFAERHRALRVRYVAEPHMRPMGTGLDILARHKDGSDLPVEISLSPVETDDDAFVLAIVRDVSTQRRLLEAQRAAVRESEQAREHLKTLVQLSPVGIVSVNSEGAVTFVNDEARRLGGLDPSQAPADVAELGKVVRYRDNRGELYEAHQLPLQRCLRTGEHVQAEEVHFELEDGTAYATLVSAARVQDSDGQPLGAVATIQEISERARAETARADFVAMVRHEIATPLTVVMGRAERGLRQVEHLDAVGMEALLREILNQAQVIQPLLTSLDEYAHIQSAEFDVTFEQVDLRSLLGEVARSFDDLTGRGGDLELQVEDALGELEADPLRLREVLLNLLSNAAKFSDHGSPVILQVGTDSVGNVRLRVRDHGFGIAPEALGRLFQPFTRLHRDRDIPGTGLGLAISRQIVEAHGGTIEAASDGPGAGSMMTVLLPRHPQHSA